MGTHDTKDAMDEQSLNKQARIRYIDLLRAFGIFVMIMGHVAFGNLFDKWIHIYHMPMFFIIGGYFYKDRSFKSILSKRTRTLLLPYVILGLLHICIYYFRQGKCDAHAFYLLLWENTEGEGIPIAGALWFLTAMFFSETLFWIVQHIKVNKVIKTIIATVVAIAGMASATYLPFRLPLAFDVGMVGVGFYQVGKLMKDRASQVLEINLYFSVLGIVAFSALGFGNTYVNLRLGNYGIWPLFWINAVGMTIALWNFSRNIYCWVEKKGILQKQVKYIRDVGKDSIIYLCFYQLTIMFARDLVNLIIPDNLGGLHTLIRQLAILIVAMLELYVIHKIVIQTKIKYIFGK